MAKSNGNGKNAIPTVDDILRGSAHALTVFKPGAAESLENIPEARRALSEVLRDWKGTAR